VVVKHCVRKRKTAKRWKLLRHGGYKSEPAVAKKVND
jgi:hypothetical protein